MKNGPFGDWKAVQKLLGADRFREAFYAAAKLAMERIGLRFVAAAVKGIRDKRYEPNSLLTEAFKGTSTPLVVGGKEGDLVRALSYKADISTLTLWVGVSRNARSKDGQSMEPIAIYLHEGATIDVTKHPGVRRFVFAKLHSIATGLEDGDAGKAQQILDGMKAHEGQGKAVWTIPARPFIAAVVEDTVFQMIAYSEFQTAVKTAMLGSLRSA